MRLDPTDRRIVAATQAGLDFTPYTLSLHDALPIWKSVV